MLSIYLGIFSHFDIMRPLWKVLWDINIYIFSI